MAFDTSTWRLPPAIVCPKKECGSVLRLAAYFPGPYFRGEECKCPSCGNSFDLWDYALEWLKKKSQLFRYRGAAFIGGREVTFTFQLIPNQTAEVDLSQYRVPEDAKLIYMTVTPCFSAGMPILLQGNQLIPQRPEHKMCFYGRQFPHHAEDKAKNADRHDIDMSVTYIPRTPDQIAFEHLADAYEKFLENEYQKMLIPSYTAVECALGHSVTEIMQKLQLPRNLRKRDIRPPQLLAVIVPLVCRIYSIQPLGEPILGLIDDLRGQRNLIAHEGLLKDSLDLEKAAQFMVAAMFVVNFLVYLRKEIEAKAEGFVRVGGDFEWP